MLPHLVHFLLVWQGGGYNCTGHKNCKSITNDTIDKMMTQILLFESYIVFDTFTIFVFLFKTNQPDSSVDINYDVISCKPLTCLIYF